MSGVWAWTRCVPQYTSRRAPLNSTTCSLLYCYFIFWDYDNSAFLVCLMPFSSPTLFACLLLRPAFCRCFRPAFCHCFRPPSYLLSILSAREPRARWCPPLLAQCMSFTLFCRRHTSTPTIARAVVLYLLECTTLCYPRALPNTTLT